MQDCDFFTFRIDHIQQDCDLMQDEANEGLKAMLPLDIEGLSKNMHTVEVSKKKTSSNYQILLNEDENKMSKFNQVKKVTKKSTSTSTDLKNKITLKDEIRSLLRACASVK